LILDVSKNIIEEFIKLEHHMEQNLKTIEENMQTRNNDLKAEIVDIDNLLTHPRVFYDKVQKVHKLY